MRVRALVMAAAVAAAAAVQLLPRVRLDPLAQARSGLLTDDAFFYGVIVRNIWRHGVVTFDGVTTTNGFQPLWLLIQLASSAVFRDVEPMRIAMAASWTCYAVFAGLLTWYVVRRGGLRDLAAAVVPAGLLVLQASFQRFVITGLEVPLLLALLPAYLLVVDRTEAARVQGGGLPAGAAGALGVISALVFLTRTDMFWVPVVTGAWLCWRERRVSRAVIAFAAAAAVLVLPYLVFNLWSQGSLMPISGRVKLFYMTSFYPTLGAYLRSDEWQGPFHAFDTVFGLSRIGVPLAWRYAAIAGAVVAGMAMVWRARRSPAVPFSLKLLSVIVALHLGCMQFVYRELRPYTAYYFVPELVWFALLAATGVRAFVTRAAAGRHAPAGRPRVARAWALAAACAVIASMIVSAGSWWFRRSGPNPRWTGRLALAADIARLVPPGESIAAFWPGAIAYYSGRGTVALDGIVGSTSYLERVLKPGREFEYLREQGVRHVVALLNRDAFDRIAAPLDEPVTPPVVTRWRNLGTLRVFAHRHALAGVVSSRPSAGDSTWYLFRLQ